MKSLLRCLAVLVLMGCSDDSPAIVETPPAADTAYASFASVAAGLDHTCAITSVGDSYCWGRGPTGALGADSLASAISPARVLGSARFAQITAGEEHTCALDVQGENYCWGANAQGQLGLGDLRNRMRPAAETLTVLKFRELSAGAYHTCGVTVENRGYCWGWNPFGQVGNNSTVGQWLPVEVHGNLPFATISAGAQHSCGVTTAGAAYCWGTGTSGQLGDGTFTSRLGAVAVTGNQQFAKIAAGGQHTCALTTTGAAFCWGAGEAGQLGNSAVSASARPVAVSGSLSFVSIDAGAEHTCGVTREAQLYCWGHNNFGRLGSGVLPTVQPAPVQVVIESARFASVSVGRLHSCALTTGSQLYCWGFGGFGQLGTGAVLNHLQPTRVLIPTGTTGAP